jgi:hypothetical protein
MGIITNIIPSADARKQTSPASGISSYRQEYDRATYRPNKFSRIRFPPVKICQKHP